MSGVYDRSTVGSIAAVTVVRVGTMACRLFSDRTIPEQQPVYELIWPFSGKSVPVHMRSATLC